MAETGLVELFDFLLINDSNSLLDLFDGEPNVDDQVFGPIIGEKAFKEFITKKYEWLNKHEARTVVFKVTEDDKRYVIEYILYLDQGKYDLPIAIVADKSGSRYSQLRIYHSTWPYTGKHSVRKPVLDVNHTLEIPEIIQTYMNSLSQGDVETIINLYDAKGYFREPSGSKYKHEGTQRITDLYTNFLSKGGIKLEHCSATYNDKTVAIEYIANEWGGVKLSPQAGLASYDISENNKLVGARVYDDIEPPM